MSVWNALWAASGVTQVTQNPQGTLAAPVGAIAVDGCGNVFRKLGGGSTAYGWYLFESTQQIDWLPNWVNAAAQMTVNRNTQAIAVAPSTIINFLPSKSAPGSGEFSNKRQYVGGYTSGIAGNSFLYKLTSNTDSMPTQRIDTSVATNFLEFDWFCDLVTTPRSSSAASSTDLTTNAMRIWAGGVWGTNAVQAVGGTVSSDTLYTEWPTAFTATNGLFGFAFRWSSAVDVNWKFISANAPGGVQAQNVTDMLVPPAINTAYRLRVRFVLVSGVLTAYASINDGTEIAVTNNVGPGATPAPNQIQPFQPLASVRQINATAKSMALAQISLVYGTGVGVTC